MHLPLEDDDEEGVGSTSGPSNGRLAEHEGVPSSFRQDTTTLPAPIGHDLSSTTGIDECLDSPKEHVLMWMTLALAIANAADAVEVLCIGFIMMELNLSSEYNEFLTASVFTGMLVGGLICGTISDRYGRRSCLLFSLGLNAVAGLLSACAPTVSWLIFFRVLAGVGIGCSIPTAFTLGAEVFPTHRRGKLLSLVASFYMVGALFTAFWAWIMLGKDVSNRPIMPQANWRWFAVMASVPAVGAWGMTYRLLPESPRFLVVKERYAEAVVVVNNISKLTTTEDDLRTWVSGSAADPHHWPIVSRSHQSNYSSQDGSYHCPEADDDGTERNSLFRVPTRYQNSPFFRDGKLRRTVRTLLLIWFTLSFGSYGISTWISRLFRDLGGVNPYADSFIFAAANLPGNVASYLLIERVGRRNLLLWGMTLAAVCSVSFATDVKQRSTVVTCAALFNAMSVVGWNSLDCLSVEYFPTASRTTAMGLLSASGRLGAIVAQFVNGGLEGNIPLLLVVTSGCMLVGGLSAWWLPEDPMGKILEGAGCAEGARDDAVSVDRIPVLTSNPPETIIEMATLGLGRQPGDRVVDVDMDQSFTLPVEAKFNHPRRVDNHTAVTLEGRI